MRFSILKTVIAASVIAVSAGAAFATTVSLRYDGATSNGGVDFEATPGGVTPVYDPAGAFGFKMTDVTEPESVLGSFIAWCLDITHPLGTSGSRLYTITSTPFTNSYTLDADKIKRVQSVFDANYADVQLDDRAQAAGFQIALWNALYDSDSLAGSGVFAVKSGGSYSGIATKANDYLAAAAAYSGARLWNLTFLQSAETEKPEKVYQNLVTASPVPVPAAASLMLLALGGLAAVGRRRRLD